MANNTIIISFGRNVNAVTKTGKHEMNKWTSIYCKQTTSKRGGGGDDDGGGEKRCEKLLAAMEPFCLNQIEISTLYACWLFEIVQMNEETEETRGHSERGKKRGWFVQLWKDEKRVLLNSNNYGWRRVQYHIQLQWFCISKKNSASDVVTCVTFCLSKTPLHLHYDCVWNQSIDLFMDHSF